MPLAGHHSFMTSIVAWTFLLALLSCDSDTTEGTEPPPFAATAAIMPLGDSITESSSGLPTYRYYLWKLAMARSYHIDFVGSQRGMSGGLPLNGDFDLDHEGHSGWRADEILSRMSTWARDASPDIVLLHVGHNDLCQGQDVRSTVNDVAGIIDALRTVKAHVTILVAQLIASADPCHAQIPAFNAELPALAAAKSTPLSPVILVDQYTGFVPATMTFDGVHPNATGQSQMADRWFATLAPLLDKFFAAAH